jgi:hypothetical protein
MLPASPNAHAAVALVGVGAACGRVAFAQPFVQACLDMENIGEAVRYVPKVADVGRRGELWLLCGNPVEALEAGLKSKNVGLLDRLATRCTVPEVQARAAAALRTLTA